jgi:hypothetical protein
VLAVKLPVAPPLQATFTDAGMLTTGLPVLLTLKVTASVQLFTSLIITVCVPAANPVTLFAPNGPPLKE